MELAQIAPWPVYRADAAARVAALVTAGDVYDYSGHGPVLELERAFSALHAGRHAVSFNSGTSALFAALAGLGIGRGDEVIVPNLTFLASASPLLWLGAHAVFADSSEDEPSVSPAAIARAITVRTTAVVVTHLFGNPVDVEAVSALCRSRGIRLIEDCSHAHASVVGGAHVGTFGDAAIYSLGAGKLVSGGHGGMLVTQDAALRDAALLIGHFKPRTRSDLVTPDARAFAEFALGGNLRMSPLAAALALDHMSVLDELAEARCANAEVVDAALEGLLVPVRSPQPRSNRSHFDLVYALPPGRPSALRADVLRELDRAGIPATAPSTRPLNRVLRAIAASGDAGRPELARRLVELARTAPDDADVPHSTSQHDRMVSLPANRLYLADTAAARRVGETARRVLAPLVAAGSGDAA